MKTRCIECGRLVDNNEEAKHDHGDEYHEDERYGFIGEFD